MPTPRNPVANKQKSIKLYKVEQTIEGELSHIKLYAKEHGFTPQDVRDTFNEGIRAKLMARKEEEARRLKEEHLEARCFPTIDMKSIEDLSY